MSNTSDRKNGNNDQSSDDEWIGELIWSLTKATGHLLWWAILFPTLSVPAVLTIWVALAHGARAGLLTAVLAVAAYIGWAIVEPSSFTAWVLRPGAPTLAVMVAIRPQLGVGVHPARFDRPAG